MCSNIRARDAGQRGATLDGRADKEDPEELKVEARGKVLAESASSVFLSVKVRIALRGQDCSLDVCRTMCRRLRDRIFEAGRDVRLMGRGELN